VVTQVAAVETNQSNEERSSQVTPGPILLLGPPGSGKGTQAKSIMGVWHIPQISTGDLLRYNRSQCTELGLAADRLMRQGQLVPDEMVNGMVAARLSLPDTVRGYILDGYPRTLGQAAWLDDRLDAAPNGLPVIAVGIRVSYTQLLRRVTGRRVCPTCQRIYNVYLQPPKVAGICDVDGKPLTTRADDVESVFEERMRVYEAQTAPVADHYHAKGQFVDIDGERPADEVATAIMDAVVRIRQNR
jgi:adenylate kinase